MVSSSRNAAVTKWRSAGGLSGIVMTVFAAFGGILFGYDTGTISGVIQMKDWIKTFGEPDSTAPTGYTVSTSRESLVVSILSAGTFIGALAGAPAADILGRRISIMLTCIIFCLGVALQTGAPGLATFVVGRFFAGLGVGFISTLIPIYQSECAPRQIRGALVSCYQWAIALGIFLAAVVNNATKDRPGHSAWQIAIGLQLVWALVLFVGMIFLPETPRWLVMVDRPDRAIASLSRLRSLPTYDPALRAEIDDIVSALERERKSGQNTYAYCFSKTDDRIAFRTLSSIALQGWQQLTGINFISYYGVTFFTSAGIKNPFLIIVVVNAVESAMTLVGAMVVDRFGRRSMLIWGAVSMCICEFLIAILGVTVSVENLAAQRALIALVCIYVSSFAATWGPVAWVVTGEIFPLNIRAKGVSMSAASNWLWNWVLAFVTPYLVNTGRGNAGLGVKVFFVWGATCAGCATFAYFCIPETKGLSLEQIDVLYRNSTPITSVNYRLTLIAEATVLSARDVERAGREGSAEKDGGACVIEENVAGGL